MTTQTWNASDYATNARFVSDLGQAALDLLDPKPGERILDLGCGDGALTARLGERGASVVGIDPSPEMVAAARARGLDVRLTDAREIPFTSEFDAVFTNAVLHWIPTMEPVLDGVLRALRPNGRFVGEFGGHGCMAAVVTARRAVTASRGVDMPFPWYFPTADEFERRLRAAGFEATTVRLIPRPTILPSGMDAWIRTFATWAFESLPEDEQAQARTEAVELLRPSLCDRDGHWTADYVRVRFSAWRPGRSS
jgi:SAM-dependent methyltransferase